MLNRVLLGAVFVVINFVIITWYVYEGNTLLINTLTSTTKHEKHPKLKYSLTDRFYFATFAITIPSDITVRNKQEWSYVFNCVPTVMAWKRIGYRVIVFLVFDYERLSRRADHLMRLVVKHMLRLKTKILYVNVKQVLAIRLSQVIRVFASHLVRDLQPNDFVMTGDSDLWPINRHTYYPPPNKTILSTARVGEFKWKGRFVRHIAMSCVGMPARLWRYIYPINFDVSDEEKLNTNDIDLPDVSVKGVSRNYYDFKYLKPLFKELHLLWGDDVYKATWHGGLLWYMDQWYLSLGIDKYGKKHGWGDVLFMEKRPCRRIDRIKWEEDINSTTCRSDAHVLQGEIWADTMWKRLTMLIKEIHPKEKLDYLNDYRKQFGKEFNKTLWKIDKA